MQSPRPAAVSGRRRRKAVADVEPAILRISREVWENAELSRQEMKSHAIHIRELEAEGFTITSRKRRAIRRPSSRNGRKVRAGR